MSEIPQKDFYKITEVCQYTDTQPYVLRFWESEFPQLHQGKRSEKGRVYSRSDIDLVQRIKQLLYDEEYTIAGARRKLEDELGGETDEDVGANGGATIEPDARTQAPPAAASVASAPAAQVQAPAESARRPTTPRLPLEAAETDGVPRERYQNAVDEIDHLRLQLKEAEKHRRKAEAALERSETLVETLRTRAEHAQLRLTRLLEELD